MGTGNTGLNLISQTDADTSKEQHYEDHNSTPLLLVKSSTRDSKTTHTSNKHIPYITNSQIASIVRRVMNGSPEEKCQLMKNNIKPSKPRLNANKRGKTQQRKIKKTVLKSRKHHTKIDTKILTKVTRHFR